MKSFSIKESIKFGWSTFKARPWLFVQVGLILFALQILTGFDAESVSSVYGSNGFALVAISLFLLVIQIVVPVFVGMGSINFYLKANDDVSSAKLADLWAPEHFLRFLVTSAAVFLIVIAGLILLIVPGIILGLALSFATYLVVDEKMGTRAAIKRGFEITKGKRWKLFQFMLVLGAINILGMLALGIGLLVTVPLSGIALAHVYRSLTLSTSTEAVA